MKICSEVINFTSDKISCDYKICLLADIHNTKYSKQNKWEDLSKEIASINPDIILIAGDFIYTSDDLFDKSTIKKLEYLFSKLRQIAPTYFCLGNHDLKVGNIHNASEALCYFQSVNDNIKLLNNESVTYKDFNILGINPVYESYYPQFKEKRCDMFISALLKESELLNFDKNGKFNILITHSPEVLIDIESYLDCLLKENNQGTTFQVSQLKKIKKLLESTDLFLCGHMHDGLIPKHWQKLGIIRNGVGIKASEGDSIKSAALRKSEYCRGVHKCFNGNLIITGGITKWCHPNVLFSLIDNQWAKDLTILKIRRKIK